MDYGHPLEFDYFLTPDAGDPLGVLETARLVDGLGYDLIGVQDHPYQPRHLDTMSLLAAILPQTGAVRVFAAVGNLPLRPPAMLAKAAATLDLLSGGRFELGIGAGAYLEPAHAMGAPARTPAESLAALEEAVAVMRAMWSGERRGLRFDVRHYQLKGIHPGPAPGAAGSHGACRVCAKRPAASAPKANRPTSPGGASLLGVEDSLSTTSSPAAAAIKSRLVHECRNIAGSEGSERATMVARPSWPRRPDAAPRNTLPTTARRRVVGRCLVTARRASVRQGMDPLDLVLTLSVSSVGLPVTSVPFGMAWRAARWVSASPRVSFARAALASAGAQREWPVVARRRAGPVDPLCGVR